MARAHAGQVATRGLAALSYAIMLNHGVLDTSAVPAPALMLQRDPSAAVALMPAAAVGGRKKVAGAGRGGVSSHGRRVPLSPAKPPTPHGKPAAKKAEKAGAGRPAVAVAGKPLSRKRKFSAPVGGADDVEALPSGGDVTRVRLAPPAASDSGGARTGDGDGAAAAAMGECITEWAAAAAAPAHASLGAPRDEDASLGAPRDEDAVMRDAPPVDTPMEDVGDGAGAAAPGAAAAAFRAPSDSSELSALTEAGYAPLVTPTSDVFPSAQAQAARGDWREAAADGASDEAGAASGGGSAGAQATITEDSTARCEVIPASPEPGGAGADGEVRALRAVAW